MTWHVRRLVCRLEFGPGDHYLTKNIMCAEAMRPHFIVHSTPLARSLLLFYPPPMGKEQRQARMTEIIIITLLSLRSFPHPHNELMNPPCAAFIDVISSLCTHSSVFYFFWNRDARWCGVADEGCTFFLVGQLPNGSMMGQWVSGQCNAKAATGTNQDIKNGGYLPLLLFSSSYHWAYAPTMLHARCPHPSKQHHFRKKKDA